MDPLRQILAEHDVIERAADVLEKITDGLEDGINVPAELIMTDIGLLMECMEEYHLGKEEGVLLPYLKELGKNQLTDALQGCLDDYAAGRQFILNVVKSMENYGNGDRDAAVKIMQDGRRYVQLIRALIEKEEGNLFSTLKQNLNETELDELEEKIQDFDYSWGGARLNNYQKFVRELERKASLSIW